MNQSRFNLWWERRRPAPVDVFTPAIQFGRFRTWINAILKRTELLRARAEAWKLYQPLLARIKVSKPHQPGDRIGRFVHQIMRADLPSPARYLEIGAFEGGSVAFVYSILKGNVKVTVVDPFIDYSEAPVSDMSSAFKTFMTNIAAIGATDSVRVLKGRSIDHLPKLIDAGEQFDIIFIDGSHEIPDVMIDAMLGWRLLARGGLMIFDDYWYRRVELGPLFRPKLAVDGFVGALSREIEVIEVAGQVFIRKK